MAQMHWSEPYLNFITIEVVYEDGARQGWDYDCYQYETLEELKLNMEEDFAEPRLDRTEVMLYFTQIDDHYTVDLEATTEIALTFVNTVFGEIENLIGGVVS